MNAYLNSQLLSSDIQLLSVSAKLSEFAESSVSISAQSARLNQLLGHFFFFSGRVKELSS